MVAITPLERLTRVVSSEVRDLLGQRELLDQELAGLLRLNSVSTGDAIGIHSAPVDSIHTAKWFQVDLGSERSMDAIVLVPAHVEVGEYSGRGYGFPLRLRIEIANDEAFTLPRIVADFTREDFPNPGISPVLIRTGGERARHVRVTATRLWKHGHGALFALGELLVMSGNRNLAVGRPVRASDSHESLPQWASFHLVDGQSLLGLPVETAPSLLNGYHSLEREARQDAIKWVQVDLGRSFQLEEVRLIPSRPRDWVLVSGFGFPLRFRVEVSEDPTFAVSTVIRPEDTVDFRNPGENAVTIPCEGVVGRFVRVTATKLWLRTDYYAFALAELQVFSRGTNVALGTRVEALDSVESGYWSSRGLVDGCSSQQRLAPLGTWLEQLGRRLELEQKRDRLSLELAREVQQTLEDLTLGSISVLLVAGLGIGLLIYRSRLVRWMELERLRSGIARDLHDELGTRLTRLGILAEVVQRQIPAPHPTHHRVSQLAGMTQEIVRSMDEIVWAVNPGNDTLEDLANYIFHFTEEFFRDSSVSCRLDIPAELPLIRLSTELRHHLFLAVKEALNNVVRHAGARNVKVRLRLEEAALSLVIEDDGRGFELDSLRPGGNGIQNMQQRLEKSGGRVDITGGDEGGTRVRFWVPLPVRRRWWKPWAVRGDRGL